MMDQASVRKVTALLRNCNVMSIATSEGGIPWAASVFFVADNSFNLYFISGQGSRHSRNINTNPSASATVNKDHRDWFSISGLQIEGNVDISPLEERERTLARYLNKFPNLIQLRDNPSNKGEKLIAERILSSGFYRLQPRTIRLIDNSLSFGFKTEMRFPHDGN